MANDTHPPVPDNTAEALLAKRRDLHRARRVVAEDRWNRFRKAAARRVGLADKGPTEQRIDLMLARAKWPGRAALIARSGVWDFKLRTGLGRDGGQARECGWCRLPADLRDVSGSRSVRVAAAPNVELARLRIYGRALRTADAVGNYHAGR